MFTKNSKKALGALALSVLEARTGIKLDRAGKVLSLLPGPAAESLDPPLPTARLDPQALALNRIAVALERIAATLETIE